MPIQKTEFSFLVPLVRSWSLLDAQRAKRCNALELQGFSSEAERKLSKALNFVSLPLANSRNLRVLQLASCLLASFELESQVVDGNSVNPYELLSVSYEVNGPSLLICDLVWIIATDLSSEFQFQTNRQFLAKFQAF